MYGPWRRINGNFVWPPELDPLEAFGDKFSDGGANNQVHVGFNSKLPGEGHGEWVTINGNITDGQHRYSVLWTGDEICMYFDRNNTWSGETPADMHTPM